MSVDLEEFKQVKCTDCNKPKRWWSIGWIGGKCESCYDCEYQEYRRDMRRKKYGYRRK